MRIDRRYVLAALFSPWILFATSSVVAAANCDSLPERAPAYLDSVGVFQFHGGAGCWGYTAPDGTQYALMGASYGIAVVNVSEMSVVGMIPSPQCGVRELKTYRHYVYAVSDCPTSTEGLMIIDLSFLPDSLHLVGSFGQGRSHCISVDTARGFCYLVVNYGGFRVLSLANPEAPTVVATVSTGNIHDMTAFNDTVYVAEGTKRSFSIWDMTEKTDPRLLARVGIPNGGYVHNIWPTANRSHLVTTEETALKTVKIWNRADLSNIHLVGEYLGSSLLAHNAHVEGNLLYIAHYQSGVSVLDISEPSCPTEMDVFDTFEPSDQPTFNGCWGVYPHTGGSGLVYASNKDGRLFIFRSVSVWADFTATPTIGQAPLNVAFYDASIDAQGWQWGFGTGDSSTIQDPNHVYGPGLHDVELKVATPNGDGVELKRSFITALAETLFVRDTTVLPGGSLCLAIRHKNYVPLMELKLPIALSGASGIASLDSITTDGCRTDYFEGKSLVFDNRGNGQAAVLLKADQGGGAPPLMPGDGPVARVWVHVDSTAVPGQKIVLSMPPLGAQSQHMLSARTVTTGYVPVADRASITVRDVCSCLCHADPVCDGASDVVDVVIVIDRALDRIGGIADTSCPANGSLVDGRADLDCSGLTDIQDVVLMIDVVFRGGNSDLLFCRPCL